MSAALVNFPKKQNFEEFTSSGSFTVPTGVEHILVTGCGGGGGGGGGGGAWESSNNSASGGSGGAGSSMQGDFLMNVTPGDILTVTIGAGGIGGAGGLGGVSQTVGSAGANGGDTTITGFDAGQIPQVIFPGAAGGPGGRILTNAIIPTPTNNVYSTLIRDGNIVWNGGAGGKTKAITSDSGAAADTETSIQGGTITGAVGGVGGTQVGGGLGGGGGGGGASSNFGPGGVGGRGANNTSTNNVAGSDAPTGNYGAAGGGGGGGSEAGNVAGKDGGVGDDGYLKIMW